MKKRLIILAITTSVFSCSKDDEQEKEESFDCECETVMHPAVYTDPNRYSSIRICETEGIEFYPYKEGDIPMVKNMNYNKVEVYSSLQKCK
ncbi:MULTISPECIES: hypothetical protein [unclassified Cellulophaga]|uniref:hypothetical protein n=1 Tax=unclassified Cellulophaga TaxID=2634405 RepID=UPI0026E39F6E|nr:MULTISPECIES: hypothetical protein [unclassified Cellulophaga]MDO6491779.1 hypothetical protein [Cellulophaga sp. 2_MG-2023]MDO6495566.1 hypothetical protein [Cellulophaga sp. 3_MG-2023]